MELPDPERSRVVLIGTSRFDNPGLADLPAVGANVAALAARLTNPEFWGVPGKHCKEVLDPDSLVTLVEPIHDAAAEAEDTLLIYYAGHGFVHPQSLDLLLALTGSDPARPYTAVPYDQVRHNVIDSPAKRKIVILDCCFSGRAFGGQGDEDVASETAIDGTYLLTSAPPNKQSLSPPGEPYTAFTGSLLDVLEHGIHGEGEYLRLRAVYRSVRLALKNAGRPEPQLRVDNDIGELALGRNARFLDRKPKHPAEPIATPPDSDRAAVDGWAGHLADAPRLDLPREGYGRIVIEPLGIVAEVAEILQRKQTTPKAAQRPVLPCDTDADADFPAWDKLLGRHASRSARRRRTRQPTDGASPPLQPSTIAEYDEALRRDRDSPAAEPGTETQEDPPAETKVLARPLLHVVSATGDHELRIAPAEFPDGQPARLRVVSWEQPMQKTFPADRVLLTVKRPDGVHLRLGAPVGGVLLSYSGVVMEHGIVATFRPSPSGARPVSSERRGIRRQVMSLGFAAHAAVRRWRGLFWSPSTPGEGRAHVVMLPGGATPGAFLAEGGFVAAVLLNGSETVELLSPVAGRLVESRHCPGTPLAEDEPVAFIDIDGGGSGLRRQPQPA